MLYRMCYTYCHFAERFGTLAYDRRVKHCYVPEIVGIAIGFLIAAQHNARLAALTHTPSPMNFLNKICYHLDNEKPHLLLVCEYRTSDAKMPARVAREKSLDDISGWI